MNKEPCNLCSHLVEEAMKNLPEFRRDIGKIAETQTCFLYYYCLPIARLKGQIKEDVREKAE